MNVFQAGKKHIPMHVGHARQCTVSPSQVDITLSLISGLCLPFSQYVVLLIS